MFMGSFFIIRSFFLIKETSFVSNAIKRKSSIFTLEDSVCFLKLNTISMISWVRIVPKAFDFTVKWTRTLLLFVEEENEEQKKNNGNDCAFTIVNSIFRIGKQLWSLLKSK